MIRDANNSVSFGGEGYDVCIIGGGPAGIVIALELAQKGRRVCLLEAGGLEYDGLSQAQYQGETSGLYYPPLDATRLRYLGGSTGHWGGMCFRLDEHDFEVREHVPTSGWPISWSDVAPYTSRAEDYVKVPSFDAPRRASIFGEGLDRLDQRWSSDRPIGDVKNQKPVHFGSHYRAALESEPNLDVFLNATVVDLVFDEQAGRSTEAVFRNYNGESTVVPAHRFVLAMGGLEISRFLLVLNRRYNDNIGNKGDCVGRYFMEHPVIDNGEYFITKRLYSHSEYWEFERIFYRQKPEMVVSPSVQAQNEKKKLNVAVHLDRIHRTPIDERNRKNTEFVSDLEFDRDYFFVGHSWVVGEQAPNPDSRITLSDTVDDFGLPRAVFNWDLLALDFETLREASLDVARAFIRTGLGRMRVNPLLWEAEYPFECDMSNHHMGGARMSDTVETGVVDRNCKVHGTENLFVAGSAVFTTSGHANPTFTIVQLALRLADRLDQQT